MAGFLHEVVRSPYVLVSVQEKVRQNPEFREIWEKSYGTDLFRPQRFLHELGLINSEYLR
jgi:hypothetical protein